MCFNGNTALQQIAQGGQAGLVAAGNIDLGNRPVFKIPGAAPQHRSAVFNVDGKSVVLPTVGDGGQLVSGQQAIANYQRTGKHLGVFSSPEAAAAGAAISDPAAASGAGLGLVFGQDT